MKKVIIGTALLLTTTLSVFSQTKNITVAGRVIEDDTKEPAVQATVQLLSLPHGRLRYRNYATRIFHPS